MLRDWLQLFRAHTAPATIIFVFSFYVAGHGDLLSFKFLLALLAAFMFHWLGFGHNSVMDYTAGYDSLDPNKQHFPLVAKRIKIKTAHNVIHTLMCLSSIYVIIITLLYGTNPALALASFVAALTFGHAYNDGLGKTTVLKFIPLSIYTIALGSWAYFFVASEPTALFWWVLLYVFLVAVYEIAYEGELKEITFFGEANLLRKLGIKTEKIIIYDVFIPTLRTMFLSYAILCAKVVSVVAIFITAVLEARLEPSLYILCLDVILSLFIVLTIYYTWTITKSRTYNHEEDLKNIALTEVSSAFALVAALSPICGWLSMIGIILFSIAYFVGMNRYLWRTTVIPKV